MAPISHVVGIPEVDRIRAAALVEQSFARELAGALPNPVARHRALEEGLDLDAAIGVYQGKLLIGLAGLRTTNTWVLGNLSFGFLRRRAGLGAIRASLAMKVLDTPVPAGTIRIEFLAVDADLRGHGVGASLLDAVEAYGCSIGAKAAELHVAEQNLDAFRLYQRQGFRDCGPERSSGWRGLMGADVGRRMTRELMCTTC